MVQLLILGHWWTDNLTLFFIAEVIQPPPKEEPKKKATIIDLTLSDSEDEAEIPLKSNMTNKPDSSNQTMNIAAGSRLHSGLWDVLTWKQTDEFLIMGGLWVWSFSQ